MGQPMNDIDTDAVLGITNPYSRVTCLVLYLYSMELGSPPLYSEVNRVARDMDLAYLNELGPFLQVFNEITIWSEDWKETSVPVTPGVKLSSVDYNMGGSFLLFRGAPMRDEWILPLVNQEGKQILLPGSNSCS